MRIYKPTYGYMLYLLLSLSSLVFFRDYPLVSIIFSEYILLFFIAYRLKSKIGFISLLFPLISYIVSGNYGIPYDMLGDAISYFPNADMVWHKYVVDDMLLIDLELKGVPYVTFYLHLVGAYPSIWLTEYLFASNISSSIYYLSQTYYFLVLVYILLYFSERWKIFSHSVKRNIFLFIILSPTFFELGVAVTRHYFTFFSVFLYFISFVGIIKRYSLGKMLALFLSVVFLLLGKPSYLLATTAFSLMLVWKKISSFQKSAAVMFILVLGVVIFPVIMNLFEIYSQWLFHGSSSVSAPVYLVVPFKFIMAIFSPFPWYNFDLHYNVYGGNIYFFLFHIFSSIFGLWIFFRLCFYFRKILRMNKELKELTLFGVFMSSTIVFGATGFHGYLSVFFPFFAPLISIRKYNVNIIIPILIAIFLNIFWAIFRGDL